MLIMAIMTVITLAMVINKDDDIDNDDNNDYENDNNGDSDNDNHDAVSNRYPYNHCH